MLSLFDMKIYYMHREACFYEKAVLSLYWSYVYLGYMLLITPEFVELV